MLQTYANGLKKSGRLMKKCPDQANKILDFGSDQQKNV